MPRTHTIGLIAVLAVACDDGSSTLVVQVRTDLLPGQEMAAVEVTLEGDVGVTRVDASAARDWGLGVRVLERALPRGERRLRVAAVDAAGAVVVERPVRVTLDGSLRVVTVLLTRDCQGVTCPGAGDPAAIACLGGRCVDEECVEEWTDACGARDCESATDCAAPAGACARAECSASGICFAVPDHAACADDLVCSPTLDCVPAGGPFCTDEMAFTLPDAPWVSDARIPAITVSGGALFVAWSPMEGGGAAARLTLYGERAGPPFARTTPTPVDVRITPDGDGATLALGDAAARIELHRLAPTGAQIGTGEWVDSLVLGGPHDVASSGGFVGVLWTDDRDGEPQVYFTSTNGSGGVQHRVSPGPGIGSAIALVGTGDEFFALYADFDASQQFRVARLPAEGGPPSSDQVVVDAVEDPLAGHAGWDGTRLGVAFVRSDGSVAFSSFAASLARVAGPVELGSEADPAHGVDVAFDGTGFMVVWVDVRASVHFARVAGNGTVLDAARPLFLVEPLVTPLRATATNGAAYVAYAGGTHPSAGTCCEVHVVRACLGP